MTQDEMKEGMKREIDLFCEQHHIKHLNCEQEKQELSSFLADALSRAESAGYTKGVRESIAVVERIDCDCDEQSCPLRPALSEIKVKLAALLPKGAEQTKQTNA